MASKWTKNGLKMDPKWTQNQPKGSKKPDCYYGWTIHCVLFLIAMEGAQGGIQKMKID